MTDTNRWDDTWEVHWREVLADDRAARARSMAAQGLDYREDRDGGAVIVLAPALLLICVALGGWALGRPVVTLSALLLLVALVAGQAIEALSDRERPTPG